MPPAEWAEDALRHWQWGAVNRQQLLAGARRRSRGRQLIAVLCIAGLLGTLVASPIVPDWLGSSISAVPASNTPTPQALPVPRP